MLHPTRRHTALLGAGLTVALIAPRVFGRSTEAHSEASPGGPATADATHSLQLLSPGPTSLATHNQALAQKAYTASIEDSAMMVSGDTHVFRGRALGMRNVAIVINGTWTVAVPDATGAFSALVDLSKIARGPLVVDVHAWDAPPDTHVYSVALSLRVHLFISRADVDEPAIQHPVEHPAHGRRLIWEEPFDQLSADRWYAGPKPDGQEYGVAAFLPFQSSEANPYRVIDGFLRIRASHRPDRKDPVGLGRTWITGHLSSGFPDGTLRAGSRKGYFEARMMFPAGPGTWPSFWLLDENSILSSAKDGAVEIDVVEGYGHSQTSYVATEHDWPPPSTPGSHKLAQHNVSNIGDLSLSFHDYGVDITDDTVIFYFDGMEKFRTPLFRRDSLSPFFIMLTLAISHDWPVDIPPSQYYDLWVDRVRIFE
jgi:beta-glucanase (GH16 family)